MVFLKEYCTMAMPDLYIIMAIITLMICSSWKCSFF